MKNEYVVNFQKYFEDKENVYIMLDICHNQSLSDLVRRRKRLHEVEARYYIFQLVQGVQYIHSKKVIHRDLKLGNLFLTERMGLKIGDFGLAAQVVYEGEKKRTVCGTPNYLAPEVLEANSGHSYEVDNWAIGVILYTMLCGRPPFESQEVKQTYKKIKAGIFQFPDIHMCSQAKDFIRKCLIVDISKRMTITEMLNHDFFTLVPIPQQIPVSTLVCPPVAAFVASYCLPESAEMGNNNVISASALHQTMSPQPQRSHQRNSDKQAFLQTMPAEQALRHVRTVKNLKNNLGSQQALVGSASASNGIGQVTKNYKLLYNLPQNQSHGRTGGLLNNNFMNACSPLNVGRDSQLENGQIIGSQTPNGNTKDFQIVSPNSVHQELEINSA